MQTLIASSIFAIVIGLPNALVLVIWFNAWSLRADNQRLSEEMLEKRRKSLVSGAKIARNSLIFVAGAATFYFGLSLGQGRLDVTAIQLSLEGLLGAILPLVVWFWCRGQIRRYNTSKSLSST